ncbi:conserved hypothetical protein [Frankia sp. AiPs1]|uniref:hypothetical protein n=1 Tax=Frankia sp. AiPa1 TaxID=573492 RepID=UPI00202B64C1|nr:hypothetical protein [Frankia sp. AiPa1]MCL9758047.1 hypothetical protein [Frankia sp. AiPa1]
MTPRENRPVAVQAVRTVTGGPPGPGRVLVDPARLRGLAGAARAAGDVLRAGAGALLRVVSLVAGLAGFADRLVRLGAGFDTEAMLLTRRLSALDRADLGLPRASSGPVPFPVTAVAMRRPATPVTATPATATTAGRAETSGAGGSAASPTGGAQLSGPAAAAARVAGRDAALLLTAGGAALLVAGAARSGGRTGPGGQKPAGTRPDARSGRRLGSPGGSTTRASPEGVGGGDSGADPSVLASSARREAVRRLDAHGDDPDFVAGFYDALGPAGLAHLLSLLSGSSTGPMGRRPGPDAGVDRHQAETALGRTFAAYSRIRTLDDGWLGRFNTAGRNDSVDAVLLTPLLGAGRFGVALLDRLARLTFGPGLDTSSPAPATGPGAGPRPSADAGPTGAGSRAGEIRQRGAEGGRGGAASLGGYQVALLDAIRIEPALVARVAARHVEMIVAAATTRGLGLPVHIGLPAAMQEAWSRVVAAAGAPAVRAADPRGSADFAGRLARAVAAADEPRLSLRLRAAFVPVLRTYRDEIYGTATAVVSGRTGAAAPADQLRDVPVADWQALLRECLRGGALAGTLARDVASYAVALEEQQAARTRGWNGQPGGYPTSPRTLGYLRAARAQTFFVRALTDAADEVVREHADSGTDFRRQEGIILDLLATVATSIDPSNPGGTFAKMGVGVTVDGIEALIRQHFRDTSTTEPRRVLERLRDAARELPGWAQAYETSARLLWARRGSDPLRPVTVTDSDGRRRVYSGDPRVDGFITGPATDFLDPAGTPLAAGSMTPAQRGAYLAWLESPALVANNDRLPVLAGMVAAGDANLPADRALRPGGSG